MMADQMMQHKADELAAKQTVPTGYKQTEVGVIPEDWDVKRISDIADVFSGGTPNRENPKYWDGNVPWITTTLIDGKDIIEANEFITEAGVVGSSVKWCRPGAILMAMYGQGKTRGKVAILSFNATINQACAAIELKDLTSSVFVLHMLTHMYKIIRELSNAGGQENLSGFIIKNIRVPYPQKQERIAIANSLSDTDALISGLEQLIAKKQAIKTATMQQLLTGRTRLPQFALRPDGTQKGYKTSELGKIPEDWEVLRIAELGQVDPENLGSSTVPDYEFDYVSLEQVSKGTLIGTTKMTFRNAPSRARRVLKRGDVLVSTVRPNLMSHYFVNTEVKDLICSTGFSVVRPCEGDLCPSYLYQHLFSVVINNQIEMLISGSNYPAINSTDVRQLKIQIGSFEEQTAIATILSDMDSELTALEQKLAKARDVKQGMMQQLLTGTTRLKKPLKEAVHE